MGGQNFLRGFLGARTLSWILTSAAGKSSSLWLPRATFGRVEVGGRHTLAYDRLFSVRSGEANGPVGVGES